MTPYLTNPTEAFTEILPATASSPKGNGYTFQRSQTVRGGFLTLDMGKRNRTRYFVVQFESPWEGVALHFAKLDEGSDVESEGYDVFVCARGGHNTSCTCKGFTYGKGKPCKHVQVAVDICNYSLLEE